MEKKQIIKPNEDCDAEYFLCSWFDINSIPKHNMILPGHDICELMEEYHRQKSAALLEPYQKLVKVYSAALKHHTAYRYHPKWMDTKIEQLKNELNDNSR